jgi:hypothetical protein
MRPIPVSAGAAATHARPPRAHAAARVFGARSEPCRARPGALLPARLLAAVADLAAAGVRIPAGPRLREACSNACRVVLFYCR